MRKRLFVALRNCTAYGLRKSAHALAAENPVVNTAPALTTATKEMQWLKLKTAVVPPFKRR